MAHFWEQFTWITSKSLMSLFCHEQLERFAHIALLTLAIRSRCSFVKSNKSDLLMVAPLSWATWANRLRSLFNLSNFEQKSEELMSERAYSQACSLTEDRKNLKPVCGPLLYTKVTSHNNAILFIEHCPFKLLIFLHNICLFELSQSRECTEKKGWLISGSWHKVGNITTPVSEV